MTAIRVLVGTRKGASVLNSDEAGEDWTVDGRLFPGWEIYHVNASPGVQIAWRNLQGRWDVGHEPTIQRPL